MKQNATDLQFAQSLTNAEQNLFEALLNPKNIMKSVADICKANRTTRFA